ncbi:zf-HC2 domain-containing protein [Syntrophomonas curvata]
MKKELPCSIVQDLLPNYIERLTGDDTNQALEQHLDACEGCKKAYEQMADDIGSPERVPVIELRFLKKVKRTRLLAAALCVVLTLVLSYLIYASEYKFTNDKSSLAAAVTEFTAPFKNPVDAYVLETKEVDGRLVASFKDQADTDVYGMAVLMKGFNQKYRIVRAQVKSSDYSSVVQMYPVEIKDERYVAVSGYNLSDEIEYYGLDYNAYSSPGYLSEDRVRKSIKFKVKNPQFLEIYHAEELDSLFEKSAGDTLYNPHLVTTSMYDADGREITEKFINQEGAGDRVSSGIGKAELFMLYVFIMIVMGLGYIFTRYFLTE